MKKYEIIIEETVVKTFEITAIDEEEAVETAIEQYRNGELDMSNGEVQFRQLSTDNIEWMEF